MLDVKPYMREFEPAADDADVALKAFLQPGELGPIGIQADTEKSDAQGGRFQGTALYRFAPCRGIPRLTTRARRGKGRISSRTPSSP